MFSEQIYRKKVIATVFAKSKCFAKTVWLSLSVWVEKNKFIVQIEYTLLKHHPAWPKSQLSK